MTEFFLTKYRRVLLPNPHFWVCIAISIFLILIYRLWPWPEWGFTDSKLHWLAWLSSWDNLVLFELRSRFIGILFLLPIIYATIMLKWQGTLIISLLALIGVLPIMLGFWASFNTWSGNFFLLLLPAIALLVVKIELELRRKDREMFLEREKERQAFLAKILEAQEKERQRIAQELHDESVQSLLAVASYAELIESDYVGDVLEMKKNARWIKETTRHTVEDLRRISVDLRLSILDNMGLVRSLKWLTERINKEHSIPVRLVMNGLKKEINPAIEITLFRVVQEALHNIARHSKASEASIKLESSDESIKITIRDNGQGFIQPERLADLVTEGKLGLIGIQERVTTIGGTFRINSKPNEGTLLSMEIPY